MSRDITPILARFLDAMPSSRREGQMSDYQLVLQAAERILKMDYPNDLTQEERLERFNEDAAFCASYIEDQAANDLRR